MDTDNKQFPSDIPEDIDLSENKDFDPSSPSPDELDVLHKMAEKQLKEEEEKKYTDLIMWYSELDNGGKDFFSHFGIDEASLRIYQGLVDLIILNKVKSDPEGYKVKVFGNEDIRELRTVVVSDQKPLFKDVFGIEESLFSGPKFRYSVEQNDGKWTCRLLAVENNDDDKLDYLGMPKR